MSEVEHVPAARPRRTALIASGVVAVLMVGFIGVLALGGDADEQASPLIGQAAPPVEGETLDGASFSLDDHRGRWVLVNFFATWCPPCRVEHPELVAFHEGHAGSGDVEVVSVAFQDERDDIAAFFAENGGDWPVLAEGVDSYAVSWGVTKLPESFLVSPQGVVVHKFVGGVTHDGLESILAQARGLATGEAGGR